MKKICDLIKCDYNFDVFGVADDSRNIKEGYLFVCTKGYYVDHFDFIDDAICRGAVAIVADREVLNCSVPVIVVDENINDYYEKICRRFNDICLEDFSFIGITGTDGKTTTASIIYQLFNYAKNDCAYIGTNGLLFNNVNINTNNTTPNLFELYDCLSYVQNSNCKNVVMEVSSEALLHDRVKAFCYDIVGFTNITEDHLNVHNTIENYVESKLKLLDLVGTTSKVVVNGDDAICKNISVNNMYSFGVNNNNDFIICDVKNMSQHVNFSIKHRGIKYNITSPLLGMYNVYNVSMAFVICFLKGISAEIIIEGIKNLHPVDGRREILKFGQEYDIILDYAHTYNGIKNIIDSVFNYNRIIVVTGAAGGREKQKRSKIGKLLLDKADVVIFTMDDPRYENVDDIIQEMIGGSHGNYLKIIDRRMAIFKALSLAKRGDVVLVLGKGRDNYMIIEDRKESYCDYTVIEDYFAQ